MKPLLHRLQPLARRSAYLEILILTGIYIALGWWWHPQDPVMLGVSPLVATVFLSFIALFFGTGGGLLALGLLAMTHWAFASHPATGLFLFWAALVLLYGEFRYQWYRQFHEKSLRLEGLEKKLDRMAHAFYALKVSHDQLELNYIIKPFSLRQSIKEISDTLRNDSRNPYEYLRILLEKTFAIQSISILLPDEEGTFHLVSATDGDTPPSLEDPLIREALQRRTPIYISQCIERGSHYLAALPATLDGEVKGLLVVEKMPFMSFNEDNLTAVAFLFDYFVLALRRQEILNHDPLLEFFGDTFRIELLEQVHLARRYRVQSSLLLFITDSELLAHRLTELIQGTVRHFDHHDRTRVGSCFVIALLTSFSAKPSALGLRRRLFERLEEAERKALKSSLFSLDEIHLVDPYIRQECSQ